ncbi:hypothetical protein QFC19_002632 [Naganishia cerealis]|uniref:Uncharacterized protein n=1 Tax=Naganishia cerealis TaxID=610337 RepID=A0ACC2W811_9TREE|nr:hypothetical protein QFC19_002632 [Naganishia cerealis]
MSRALESSVMTSHLSTVRQSATHLSPPGGTTTTLLDGTVHAAAPQQILMTTTTTTTGAVNPALLTSSIAHEALSTTSRRAVRNGTSLSAQLDLNVTQTTSTIREAVSNAVQEGLEEQLDKAMDMHRLVTMGAAGTGPTVAGAAV